MTCVVQFECRPLYEPHSGLRNTIRIPAEFHSSNYTSCTPPYPAQRGPLRPPYLLVYDIINVTPRPSGTAPIEYPLGGREIGISYM